ncbi:MAG: Phage shock protein [Pseudomonadota bacterium]
MRRVITVSLNGNAYQLEDDACELLSTYLDEAARALAGDPDCAEIIADLEQAIADKCGRFLDGHKGVLARAEIAQVIAEMGPVDSAGNGERGAGMQPDAQPGANAGAQPGDPAGRAQGGHADPGTGPRRLYQISEGAVISGVCNGFAAYFGIDVTLVRVLAVAIAFLSGGLAVLAYLVLMFIVPYASTSEERAAAHGLPFNARELVERAKRKYREFAQDAQQQARDAPSGHAWRRDWRHARAQMRAARRQARTQWRRHSQWRAAGAASPMAAAPVNYGVHVLTRLAVAVVGVCLAVFMVGWLLSFLSFLATGAFFGLVLPFHAPGWLVIVGLFVLYGLVTGPLRAARHAAATPWHPYPGAMIGALDGLLVFAAVIALLVYASHHGAEVRALFEQLRDWLISLKGPTAPTSAT